VMRYVKTTLMMRSDALKIAKELKKATVAILIMASIMFVIPYVGTVLLFREKTAMMAQTTTLAVNLDANQGSKPECFVMEVTEIQQLSVNYVEMAY